MSIRSYKKWILKNKKLTWLWILAEKREKVVLFECFLGWFFELEMLLRDWEKEDVWFWWFWRVAAKFPDREKSNVERKTHRSNIKIKQKGVKSNLNDILKLLSFWSISICEIGLLSASIFPLSSECVSISLTLTDALYTFLYFLNLALYSTALEWPLPFISIQLMPIEFGSTLFMSDCAIYNLEN